MTTSSRIEAPDRLVHLREAGVSPALLGPLTAALSGAMNELALWLVARPDDDDARTDAHAALDRLLNAVAPRR